MIPKCWVVETVCVKESHIQRTKMCTAATHSFCIGPYFFIFCLHTGRLEEHSGFSLCVGAMEALSVPGIPLFLRVLSMLISKSSIIISNQRLSSPYHRELLTAYWISYLNFPRPYKPIVFLPVITLGNGLTLPQGDWVGILSIATLIVFIFFSIAIYDLQALPRLSFRCLSK